MTSSLLQDHRQRTLTLTLNRPDKRNALSKALIEELHSRITAAASDDEVKCVILTGVDQAFCAGLDLDELAAAESQPPATEMLFDLLELIYHGTTPVIAAVNGFAVAGGAALMSVCDIVIAADSAHVGYPEIQRGLVAAIVMPFLIRQVGERHARYLLLTGEMISATEAFRIGLVNEVVPHNDLPSRATQLAEHIAGYDADALCLTKQWATEAVFQTPDQHRAHSLRIHATGNGH